MRLSAVFSALFHAAIFLAAMITISDPERFAVDVPTNIPVELLTIAEFTNISAAITEEDVIEEAVIEEAVEEEAPELESVQTAALPEPEPVFEEVVPEFSPFEEPEPEVVEAAPEPATPPPPDLGRVRQQRRPEPPSRDFDFGAAEALIDLTPETDPEPEFNLDDFEIGGQPEVADAARSRVGLGTGLTISEQDALKAQISACWSPPAGAVNAGNLIIELRLFVNSDGTVQRTEILNQVRYRSDGFYRAAVDSAVRAVERCETGTNFDGSFRRGYVLPQDRDWQSIRLTFDPSDML